MGNLNIHDASTLNADQIDAITRAIPLNNEGSSANKQGDFNTALEKFKQALEIKLRAYGENSEFVKKKIALKNDFFF